MVWQVNQQAISTIMQINTVKEIGYSKRYTILKNETKQRESQDRPTQLDGFGSSRKVQAEKRVDRPTGMFNLRSKKSTDGFCAVKYKLI